MMLAFVFVLVVKQPVQLSASEECALDSIALLPEEERNQCIQAMGGKPGFVATVEAAQRVTAQAISAPGSMVEPPPSPVHTPQPPGYIPDLYREIEPLDTAGPNRTAPSRFHYGQSVWQVGAVLTADGDATPLIIAADPHQCMLQSLVLSYVGETFPEAKVGHQWECPENISPLTITGATGPTGVVTATDELSRTITFDLSTEEWTLEGEPWLPAATPTP
jgi:hypothetical protein